MKKAGGILGLIGGSLGFICAIVTLAITILPFWANVLSAQPAMVMLLLVNRAFLMGSAGLVLSILAIVFGALCIGAKTKAMGIILLVVSVLAAILSAMLVASLFGAMLAAFCMIPVLIGAILAIVGTKPGVA